MGLRTEISFGKPPRPAISLCFSWMNSVGNGPSGQPLFIACPSEEQNELQLAKAFFLFDCNKYRIEGWWRRWRVKVDALVSGFTRLSCLKLSITVNDLGFVSQINIVICIIRYIQVSTLRRPCSCSPQQNIFKRRQGGIWAQWLQGVHYKEQKLTLIFCLFVLIEGIEFLTANKIENPNTSF